MEKNYSEVQEQEMSMVYTDSNTDKERANDVKELANKFGKSVQSIRAKLSKMGIYIKAVKVAKNGKPVVRKADMVETIADYLGVQAEDVKSLEKATVTALECLIAQFNHLESK